MITKPTSIEELKQIFTEELINHTDKITKISPGSVLNAVAFGVAKLGQKSLREIAGIEAHLLPDSAYGNYLDIQAADRGLAPRYSSLGSSTYMRLVAAPGTVYEAATVSFNGKDGVEFLLDEDVTIENIGFAYAKVYSSSTGANTNVDPLTLTRIISPPNGHKYSINEYAAFGGIDLETDEQLRQRNKTGINLLARSTDTMLTQGFNAINPKVLRVLYGGVAANGRSVLIVIAQNGADFNRNEFAKFLSEGKSLFGLNEIRPYDNRGTVFVELHNADWQPIDISLRVSINAQYDPDAVRKEIQIRLNKYLDYRNWNSDRVEWDDLLQLAKGTPGVDYVPDTTFIPNFDVPVIRGKLPRLRSFKMYDLAGNLLVDVSGNLNPVYYPATPDKVYVTTVLADI